MKLFEPRRGEFFHAPLRLRRAEYPKGRLTGERLLGSFGPKSSSLKVAGPGEIHFPANL
ncbi:hypothetical protein [Sedimenticola thiotaurini]|uniref:hypothetical protein n=1 Tax=Sedimenticola thiotaurini TaxID=1543721 RepID=UPI0019027F0D|nr:hypothetical protein [Sedimenticola thiotaurini]